MANSHYPRLFEPFELAGKAIRNRIVHAAFSTGTARGGDITKELINHGANRVRVGVGMNVTESLISDDHDPILGRIQAFKEERLDGLKRWAEALERAGFSGIELSSARAFLYLQFLSPYSNRREDEYGGDLVGRTR